MPTVYCRRNSPGQLRLRYDKADGFRATLGSCVLNLYAKTSKSLSLTSCQVARFSSQLKFSLPVPSVDLLVLCDLQVNASSRAYAWERDFNFPSA